MSRRERYRESTKDEIKAIARRQMAETGTGSVSINALAREMGMTPSGFYRYFTSRDDLISAMIADAWVDLGDTLEAADVGQPPTAFAARLMAVLHAYRTWAATRRVEFDLLFGNPIPNYQPPPDAHTADDRRRSIGVIFRILADALAAGALRPAPEHLHPPAALKIAFPEVEGSDAHRLPPVVTYVGVMGWAHLHGILMLELHGHTAGLVSDDGAFYDNEIRFLLRSVGLAEDTS